MHNANWDDLRYVLAVAEHGTVSAAARALGVNHSTVLRRISAWEDAFGAPVFERTAQGYRLRPERAAMIDAARNADTAMQAVARLMGGSPAGAGSVLRLTSVDSLCVTLLGPAMPDLARRLAPDSVMLLCSNDRLDLARLQADICLRPADTLPDEMTGERVAVLGFCVYARPGAPDTWLGLTGPIGRSRPARWLAETAPVRNGAPGSDSFVALCAMAEAGAGRAILPCILGDASPTLERIDCGFPETNVPLWTACHRDLAGSTRMVRALRAVAEVVSRSAGRLAGTVSP